MSISPAITEMRPALVMCLPLDQLLRLGLRPHAGGMGIVSQQTLRLGGAPFSFHQTL